MKYTLSNRQTKELHNGKQLRIALPHPAGDPPNYEQWAAEALAVDDRYIRHAKPDSLPCIRRGAAGPVAEHAGQIVRDQTTVHTNEIVYYVEVVLVDISTRDEPRGKYPPQWPGGSFDG